MAQALSKVYIHLVFTTKHRQHFIEESYRLELQALLVSILSKLGAYTYEIYANPDHVHILCSLPRTITIAVLVQKIKAASSGWIKTKGAVDFSWQDGYSCFSVSSSRKDAVEQYIRNQPLHHQSVSCRDELLKFYEKYEIEFKPEYMD
ncbi:IS200/IS605 family transposase [Carboxylicivirga caseinilyticus]|uniref:IS200/IS605 family transposase n=1 Tax=Carboxylicivirga caseinilyticus TaxID=3417572 RepID=UPI003D3390DE|nr:IS200/IS605 family transposase [Marinilabiliaceae bacterium A049]